MGMSKYLATLAVVAVAGAVVVGCESSRDGETFPAFSDGNGNGINDYVEADKHLVSTDDPRWHDFIDSNGDAVCDLALRANPVWHGPGYIDTDLDGMCDYWDTDASRHRDGRRDIVHGADFGEVELSGGPHHGSSRKGREDKC